MLSLKTLKFSGLGRFVEEQTIDFTTLGNLVQVDGQNNNTGGSSGAGKSTVFNGLDFLLGLNDLPNTVLQSRVTKEGISVAGEFDWDGKPITIKRTKKGLSITLPEETIEGSSKLAEEKLDEILAMPRHIFRQILHKRQKEGGFFLNLTPKQVHEFLTDVLGLEGYRSKLETLDVKSKDLEAKVNKVGLEMASATASSGATYNAINALGPAPVKEVTKESILDLKALVSAVEAQMKELNDRHVKESNELNATRPTVNIAPFDRTGIEALERDYKELVAKTESMAKAERDRVSGVTAEISKLKVEMAGLGTIISQAERAKHDAVSLASEVKRIRENICPTCEQHWNTEAAKAKEASLLNKIKDMKDIVAKGVTAEERKIVLTAEIKDLEEQIRPRTIEGLRELLDRQNEITTELTNHRLQETRHQQEQGAKVRAALDEFNAKAYALTNKQNGEALALRNQYDVARRSFDAAVNKMKQYEEASKRYEAQLSQLLYSAEKYDQKLKELNALSEAIKEELELIEEARKLIKSFISCSFDDALEYVSDVATKLIRSIPNMANATVQLEGVKETKAGAVKEEVNAVLNVDGDESVPIKSLCGGERSSLDLAIDLAVIDLIENRTNKGIDLFILDEPFTGLDTVCIEMALEVLRNTNLNKKLMIVDHNPEVKQMVQSRLIVVRDGPSSVIAQN